MPISRQYVISNVCNKCLLPIEEGSQFVDASAYSITLHKSCAAQMNAVDLAQMMGLDFQVKNYVADEYINVLDPPTPNNVSPLP